MTPIQIECLVAIDKHNSDVFGGWFKRSSVMAFIQIESAFKPHAYRYEPALNEASYGLMQILSSTAKSVGFIGVPEKLYVPETGVLYGMKYARKIWDEVMVRIGADKEPTVTNHMLSAWCDAYNRGPRGSALGSPDHAYVHLWLSARTFWLAHDSDKL